MDFQLSDEQRLISEAAREFADREIAPRVRDNDRAGRFDRELASKLGEVGYLGAPVAEEYGGRGLDYIGRSEEHTSELQSHSDLVCRLLLEKKKKNQRLRTRRPQER